MKKIISFLTAIIIMLCSGVTSFAIIGTKSEAEKASSVLTSEVNLEINGESCILMEAETGKILYAENENTRAPLASVTKIMTLLLVCEAIRDGSISLGDEVVISDVAASLGGSQVFLKEGERMNVEELIKCTVIASANDAATALAEHVSGSVSSFVDAMNRRAQTLGLENSVFENPTGLDDTATEHYSSAFDIAVMSRELIKYDIILKYSNVWQDTIRDGQFTLTNTNRLVRYYEGCTGLKTGSTDKAGYCVSTTAKRGNMHLIAVIMGAESREARNNSARTLLDHGFANYKLYENKGLKLDPIRVKCGTSDYLNITTDDFSAIIGKTDASKVKVTYEIPSEISAPVKSGMVIGKIIYTVDSETVGESNVYSKDSVDQISLLGYFAKMLFRVFIGKNI